MSMRRAPATPGTPRARPHVQTCTYVQRCKCERVCIYREALPPRAPAQPESPAFVSGKSAADVGFARAGRGDAAGERRAGGLLSEEVVETCGADGKVDMEQEEDEEMETVLDFKGGGFGVDAEKVCLCGNVCRCVCVSASLRLCACVFYIHVHLQDTFTSTHILMLSTISICTPRLRGTCTNRW